MRKPTIVKETPMHRAISRAGWVGLLLVGVLIPYSMPAFRVFQFSVVIVFAVAVLGLNLLTGYNGQISLGHSFFFAIGAYVAAILIEDHSWPYLLTLLPAFALTFALGFLFGIPALRLEGLYLALVTLGLAVVTPPFIKRFDDLTGGSQGIVVAKPSAPDWTGLADDQFQYFLCLGVAVVMFVGARNLVRGRVGRALEAIRDNHIAAETIGIDLSVFKTLAFAYSAAFAGVAGALYVFVVGFVSPESFTVLLAIEFLAGAVVGGLATIVGPLFGATFTRFMPVYAADINDAAPGLLYGVALILIMFLMPGGAVGLFRRVRDLVVDYRAPTLTGGTTAVGEGTDVAFEGAVGSGHRRDEPDLDDGDPADVGAPGNGDGGPR
jgi:branched-chain amino acid transport system permease protein